MLSLNEITEVLALIPMFSNWDGAELGKRREKNTATHGFRLQSESLRFIGLQFKVFAFAPNAYTRVQTIFLVDFCF